MRSHLILSLCCLIMLSCQPKTKKKSFANGKEVYITNCISCHQPDGKGIEGVYPSLVKQGYISSEQTERTIKLIVHGSRFDVGMKQVALTDREMVDVINYIQSSWGNEAPFMTKAKLNQLKTKG